MTEHRHKESPQDNTKRQFKEIHHKINEVEMKTRHLKQTYYEVGPKTAKLLPRKLRKQQLERAVHKIQDPKSNRLTYRMIQRELKVYSEIIIRNSILKHQL